MVHSIELKNISFKSARGGGVLRLRKIPKFDRSYEVILEIVTVTMYNLFLSLILGMFLFFKLQNFNSFKTVSHGFYQQWE